MTDKEDKKRNLRKIRGISINWEFNKPTGKEHLLLIIAIVACIFPGQIFFNSSLWSGFLYLICVAGSYAYLAIPHFKHRKEIWKGWLDQSLKEYQPLDLQAWEVFKARVSEEGMTYVAFESWMNTEASALYKEPKQEWSFVDKTQVGENDQSEPVQQISVSNKKE
ncbi:hypothetical protein [Escherichia coli]|uniref:hypothetical protein n=1 Tax=Escherichia coli TaxID=562 RepID=UPI001840B81B|nr:hypothetical protein [Escherichia coli]WHH80033.1 hypothetical protein QDY26_26040 [Escherichia coli]HAC6196753.1 hypothetical protein [Salmonella enterica subsp. enterica serovar Typhimurium]